MRSQTPLLRGMNCNSVNVIINNLMTHLLRDPPTARDRLVGPSFMRRATCSSGARRLSSFQRICIALRDEAEDEDVDEEEVAADGHPWAFLFLEGTRSDSTILMSFRTSTRILDGVRKSA